MTHTQKRTYCTDATWLGRSDCARCNIRNVMIFSGLPESTFTDQLAPVDHFMFPAGSTLFKEGDDDGAVFSVRRGIIKLSSLSLEGQPRIVRLIGPGMAIGLELIDQEEHYRHTAVALNEVDACRIPVSTVRTLELQHPEICQQIRRRLQQQLDRADQWIVELGTGSAKKRVARLIQMMTEYAGGPDCELTLPAGADIGALIGASPETVSRVMADLKRNRVLTRQENRHYRCDSTELQAIIEDGERD